MNGQAMSQQMTEVQTMDNQHRKITGYRELSQEEIDLMNQSKDLAAQCGMLAGALMDAESTDKRSVAVAKTYLQTGFMWLNRSIAKPESFG